MLLCIDTSTLTAGVAVYGDRVLAARRARVTTHSEMLLGLIDEALHEAGVDKAALTAIACGAGPGSFTGLRIGLATAKGLCFALGKPLILESSLRVLAARAPEGSRVCAVLDAHKSEVYAGVFTINRGLLPDPVGEQAVLPPAKLRAQLAGSDIDWLVGDGALRYPELCDARTRLLDDDGSPHPGDLGRIAADRLRRAQFDDLATAGPAYIRPSEAELVKMNKNK